MKQQHLHVEVAAESLEAAVAKRTKELDEEIDACILELELAGAGTGTEAGAEAEAGGAGAGADGAGTEARAGGTRRKSSQ